MDNRCVSCGEFIPEGVQVCPSCQDTRGKTLIAVAEKEERKMRGNENP